MLGTIAEVPPEPAIPPALRCSILSDDGHLDEVPQRHTNDWLKGHFLSIAKVNEAIQIIDDLMSGKKTSNASRAAIMERARKGAVSRSLSPSLLLRRGCSRRTYPLPRFFVGWSRLQGNSKVETFLTGSRRKLVGLSAW